MPADAGRPDPPQRSAVHAHDQLDLEHPVRVHVVGVGGAGMSAVAAVLAAMGHVVTGSDIKPSRVTERLQSHGVGIMVGHRPEHVAGADLVTFSPAIRPDNPELREAERRGIRRCPRSEILPAIARTRRCIAVAGTHGKTTTSSMLSLILVEAGLRPSFLIGADINDIGTNAVWDSGEWLVLEADESFGAFQSLRPEVAIVCNVEPDHLDHYGGVQDLQAAFEHFLKGATGGRVVSADDDVAAALGRRLQARSVGTADDADVHMDQVELHRSALSFDLVAQGARWGRIEVPVPGLHNARNAAMATVAAMLAGSSFEVAQSALARFAGVPRRFEFRGEARGVTFVDDYAHLPGEVRAALEAARAGRWRRVVAVFQPHRYSRISALAATFAGAFDDADQLVVTDIYPAGEAPIPGVSGKLVVDAVSSAPGAPPVTYAPGREELRQAVASLLREGDVCCTLGAGDLTTLPDELLADPRW